jgi:hypothetical protein
VLEPALDAIDREGSELFPFGNKFMNESTSQIHHGDDHLIKESEVTRMIPSASVHPTFVAVTGVIMIVWGIISEPFIALVGLFNVAVLWSECMKWVNWAKGIQHKRDREERIQRFVKNAVEDGKINQSIEELRKMIGEIPNGRFTKNPRHLERFQDMEKSLDQLVALHTEGTFNSLK